MDLPVRALRERPGKARRLTEQRRAEAADRHAAVHVAADYSRAAFDSSEYLARIEREAGRLDRMIEQLLTLARIENGVDARSSARFDLAEVVQEVVGDGDFEARGSGRHVTLVACQAAVITVSRIWCAARSKTSSATQSVTRRQEHPSMSR